ncbi:NACHT domain-containing protein, partial [Flavobacterium terrigena]
MTSQEKGAKFEKNANDFFVWLFEEIGFTVAKDRLQFSGTQDGFDIHIIATFNNFERQIHIECKDYKNDLDVGNIFKKLIDLEKNYDLTENDLFIAISPRANFKNADNSEKTSPVINDKFSFKTYLLDKSNYINELFALNDEFYRDIYNKDVNFPLDRAKEIERFKAIIFSRKPFKKIFLTEKNKTDFIGVINSNTNYLPRFLSTSLNSEDLYLFNRLSNNLQSLDDILQVENKVLLLGNPGLGKSTELKEFALSKWKLGEQITFIPIFRNLKNFTANNKIEDFLPNNFDEITNCYIIFDGLDEIKDSQDFISKLEVFIEACDNNKLKSIKFLLSCRTNIYESIVKNISDFKVFYLNNLSNDEAFKLLKKQLIDSSLIEKLPFQRIHFDFLKNPFLIEILSEYINRNNNLPNNSIQLWGNYINKRLEFDNKNKLLKLKINIPLIVNFSRKISLISELMKTNSIKETEIFELISEQTNEYLKNPLIEKDLNNDSWNFEHRNIQEFFASKYLSELSYENIIDFISISEKKKRKNALERFINWISCSEKNSINKTHPSLFNTITFLINILDDNKSQQVIKWLEKNEPEILFTADSDRINLDVKKIVFQNYFKKVCIENTFWISHNKSFNPETIAKFGDCEDNFNYLVSIVENTNNHFRVIISAIELLSYMTLPTSQNQKVQDFLLLKLRSRNIDSTNSKENDLKIKSYVITYIKKFKFHKESTVYLTDILDFFKDEDNKEINSSLLHLINSLDNDIDKYFEFILAEFLRIFKIINRTEEDEYLHSKLVIQDLILRINDSDNFIKILKYIISNESNFSINFDDSFILQIFEKSRIIASFDVFFIDKKIELLKERKHWFERENELAAFFVSTNSSTKLIDKVLSNEISLKESRHLVARLLSDDNIHLMIDKFIKEDFPTNEVEVFRNIIGNTNSIKLAKSFEKVMNDNGYVFDKEYISDEEIEEINKKREIKKQDNFDILFDVKKIELEIKKIFNEINIEKITWKLICKYQSQWYTKNNHSSEIDSSLTLLINLIRENGILSFNEVVNLIQNEDVLMTEIRRYFNKKIRFNIDSSHEKAIYDWCLKSVEKINYNEIILIKNNRY